MKIAWFCIPAHGHTNPTLGLVRELTQAGHEVYYFSFEMFRAKLEAAGARFVVPLTGQILTMPGLPKVPAAVKMEDQPI